MMKSSEILLSAVSSLADSARIIRELLLSISRQVQVAKKQNTAGGIYGHE